VRTQHTVAEKAIHLMPLALVGVVLLGSAVVDLPRRVEIGPTTGLGVLTASTAVLGALTVAARARLAIPHARTFLPFLLFVGWAAISLAWSRNVGGGAQNVLVFATAAAIAIAVAASIGAHPQLHRAVPALLYGASGLVAALYGTSLLLDGLDTDLILSPRQFALVALLCLAWTLSAWRHGSWPAGILSAGLVVLVALSLSRTALAVGLMVLMPLAFLRPGSFWGSVRAVFIAGVAGAVLFFTAIFSIDALQERFQTGDVRSVSVGTVQVEVNVQGRTSLWGITRSSIRESPWVGHGAGSVQRVVEADFPRVGHPLNDYLRILHDYGVVGTVLFALAGLVLLGRVWTSWRRAPAPSGRRLHMAAFFALIAVAATASTDNSFIYFFTMGPLAVLLGSSVGQSAFHPPTDTGATPRTVHRIPRNRAPGAAPGISSEERR
jgi:O-antigen ligase